MHFIEPFEHAAPWARKIATRLKPEGTITGVAVITLYDADPTEMPNLRDRTDETAAMLRGLAGDLGAPVTTKRFTGKELSEATDGDYQPKGAGWGRPLCVLVI